MVRNGKHWTKEEERHLQDNRGSLSIDAISKNLNRSRHHEETE